MSRKSEQGSAVTVLAAVGVAVVLSAVSVFAYTHVINPPKPTTASPSPSPSTSSQIASVSPGGNNGTLKVHAQGAPSGTEDNTPKVCNFNFEGFNFDAGQRGMVKIAPQGGSNVAGTSTLEVAFGPADSKGFAQTDYLNSDRTLANGLYKSTLYGKDKKGEYTVDLKAKSKVFDVNCAVE